MPGGWTSIGWNVGGAGFQASEAGWNPSILGLSTLLWSLDNQDPCTRTVNGTVRLIDRSRTGTARQMQPGRCYVFNGTSDHVDGPKVTGGESAMSFCAWIRSANGASNQWIGGEYDSSGNNRSWAIHSSSTGSGRLTVDISGDGTSGNRKSYQSTTSVTDDAWHHVAFTWASGTLKLYIDGTEASVTKVLDASVTTTHDHATTLVVGAIYASSPVGFWDGEIFDFRVYKSTLSDADIADLAAMAPGSVDIGPTGATVWYKCDEGGTYATAIDSSGNGNNGTITAAAIGTLQDEALNDIFSFQNELGYTDDTGSSGALLPRDESAPTLDTSGSALEFSGQAPHDPILSSPCVTLDGTADVVSYGSTGVSTTEVKLWIKQLADNQELFTLQNSTATAVTVVAGTLTYGGSLTVTATDIDGTDYTSDLAGAGALLNDNDWHELTITLSAITASNLRVGTDGSGFGNISYAHLRLNTTDLISWGCEGAGTVVHDSSGNDKHGTGTFASEAAAWANTIDKTDTLATDGYTLGLTYDGSTDYFQHTGRLTSGSLSTLSVAAWVRFATHATKYIAGEFETTGGQYAWAVYRHSGGTVKVSVSANGSTTNVETSTPTLNLNKWNHIAFVYADSAITMYFDGVAVASTTTTGTIPASLHNSTAPFEIGAADGGAAKFVGQMTGIVIEAAEWSAATVASLYTGTVPSTAWYFRDGGGEDVNQGVSITASGTPDAFTIPTGTEIPETISACFLAPGQSLDLGGGEANSPYAQQLADLLADLTYDQGDDDEADALFARVNDEGDDRIIVTIPALTGDDLTNMQEYTA